MNRSALFVCFLFALTLLFCVSGFLSDILIQFGCVFLAPLCMSSLSLFLKFSFLFSSLSTYLCTYNIYLTFFALLYLQNINLYSLFVYLSLHLSPSVKHLTFWSQYLAIIKKRWPAVTHIPKHILIHVFVPLPRRNRSRHKAFFHYVGVLPGRAAPSSVSTPGRLSTNTRTQLYVRRCFVFVSMCIYLWNVYICVRKPLALFLLVRV